MAAAMMAGLVGANLGQVDKDTLQQSSAGPAKKIDPRNFLTSAIQQERNNRDNIVAQLNKEAMERYPMPPPMSNGNPSAPQPQPTQRPSPSPVAFSSIDPKTLIKFADASVIFAKAIDRISISVDRYIKYVTNSK